jgi:hypothetical protein
MKLVKITDVIKAYSYFFEDMRPDEVWAVPYLYGNRQINVHGIPKSVIDTASELSTKWNGWAFQSGGDEAYLLFESKDDAILATVTFGGGNE